MAIVEVRKPQPDELESMTSWPIWTCDASTFDWEYEDQETCYLLEGEVTVKTDDGDVMFAAGDMVVFPRGLKCVWHVTKPVRKHYRFG